MTAIMLYHIKSKYTAVGRKEIVIFFYLYMVDTILALLLVSNIIPTSLNVYPYFTAAYVGLVTSTFWCLLLNGFVGFQWAEDGTPMSLWVCFPFLNIPSRSSHYSSPSSSQMHISNQCIYSPARSPFEYPH